MAAGIQNTNPKTVLSRVYTTTSWPNQRKWLHLRMTKVNLTWIGWAEREKMIASIAGHYLGTAMAIIMSFRVHQTHSQPNKKHTRLIKDSECIDGYKSKKTS